MPHTVRELELRLSGLARAGRAAALGGRAALSVTAHGLTAAAATGGGSFENNVDNVVLRAVRCGDREGVAAVVCQGNHKDEGCAVAAGCAAIAFDDVLDGSLLSVADVVPALRRGVLEADAAIRAIVVSDPAGFPAATAVGARRSLSGIGTCVTAAFVLPDLLHLVHVGDAEAVLLRQGRARRLTVEHTLANEPALRERLREDPGLAAVAAGAVMRVLGLGPEPRMDVMRVGLLPGDRILVGNLALRPALDALASFPAETGDIVGAVEQAMRDTYWQAPATIAVVAVGE